MTMRDIIPWRKREMNSELATRDFFGGAFTKLQVGAKEKKSIKVNVKT